MLVDPRKLVNEAANAGWRAALGDSTPATPPAEAMLASRRRLLDMIQRRLLPLLLSGDADVSELSQSLTVAVAEAREGLAAARQQRLAAFIEDQEPKERRVSKAGICRKARVDRSDLKRYLRGLHSPLSVIARRIDGVLGEQITQGKMLTPCSNPTTERLELRRGK